jgi:transcriptional regulator with XRE-family HTH domain
MPAETLSARLKRLREAAGLSQPALASRAGLSADAVRAIEQGRRADPKGSTLLRLAEALGTGVEDLLR